MKAQKGAAAATCDSWCHKSTGLQTPGHTHVQHCHDLQIMALNHAHVVYHVGAVLQMQSKSRELKENVKGACDVQETDDDLS